MQNLFLVMLNLFPRKTELYLHFLPFFSAVNSMAADDLVMQGARASVAMVLALLFRNLPFSAPEGFIERVS